jgi:hypothetical protein
LNAAFGVSSTHPLAAEPPWHHPPFCFDSQFDTLQDSLVVDGSHLLSRKSIELLDDSTPNPVDKIEPLDEHCPKASFINRWTMDSNCISFFVQNVPAFLKPG